MKKSIFIFLFGLIIGSFVSNMMFDHNVKQYREAITKHECARYVAPTGKLLWNDDNSSVH